MPVSFVPVIVLVILILVPPLCLFKSLPAARNAAIVSATIVALILLRSFIPGGLLFIRASFGSLPAQYEFARWRERYCEEIGELIVCPCEPDVPGGFSSLEFAAAKGYAPAIYALGVRLKHGVFVPRPENWTGPGGNIFPQPERGQPLIDEALRLGYQPQGPEERFYWQEFRKP
jgi:hypothetical protein